MVSPFISWVKRDSVGCDCNIPRHTCLHAPAPLESCHTYHLVLPCDGMGDILPYYLRYALPQIDVLLVDGVYYGFSGCHRFEVSCGRPAAGVKPRYATWRSTHVGLGVAPEAKHNPVCVLGPKGGCRGGFPLAHV